MYEVLTACLESSEVIFEGFYVFTVNFLHIGTPKKFVVITLEVEQDGVSLEYCIQKMQRELQTVQTLIRLLL